MPIIDDRDDTPACLHARNGVPHKWQRTLFTLSRKILSFTVFEVEVEVCTSCGLIRVAPDRLEAMLKL